MKSPAAFVVPPPVIEPPSDRVKVSEAPSKGSEVSLRFSRICEIEPTHISHVFRWTFTLICRVSPGCIPVVPSGTETFTVIELCVPPTCVKTSSSPSARASLPAGSRRRERIIHACSSHACRVRLRTISSKGTLRNARAWGGGTVFHDQIQFLGVELPAAAERASSESAGVLSIGKQRKGHRSHGKHSKASRNFPKGSQKPSQASRKLSQVSRNPSRVSWELLHAFRKPSRPSREPTQVLRKPSHLTRSPS